MKRFFLAVILFLLLSSVTVSAVVLKDSMKIFAVTTEGKGMGARLNVSLDDGTGKVWSSVKPLVGTTTQSAERTAIDVAKIYVPQAANFDYKFEFQSEASVVEGPSAGAAMTLLVVSMLRNKHVPDEVSITGTIATDGSVGPVGGVFEKAQEASKEGIRLFLVPKGEAKQIVKLPSGVRSVNLIEYALAEWGLKIVEVENMDSVLKLAFSPIETIDVNNTVDTNVFDFLPVPIEHSIGLGLMREITKKQIETGKTAVEDSKKALNSSMLEDNELVQSLLASLNNSEETLKEAELLLDRNFLYSAANYAFLAKANAMLVKDVAENPSLLSLSSTLFHSRLVELKAKIQSLEGDLSGFIPLDYLEWHIAAQQRVVYADNAVSDLLSNQTIIIDTGDTETNYEEIFKRMQDYEFAVAWFEIAENFFEQSKKSKRRILPDNAFKNDIEPLIVNVENGLALLPAEENQDILRRYNAAIREKQLGWYLAAGFDAASAIALIDSQKIIEQQNDLNTLYISMTERIFSIKEDMNKSSGSFVWANLYLDHTQYYVSGADYYLGQKSEAKALESLKSAVSIVSLAENLQTISKEYYAHYNFIPESKILRENNFQEFIPKPNNTTMTLLAIGLIAGWVLVIVLTVKFYGKIKEKKSGAKTQVEQLSLMQKNLEKELLEGKISKEKYSSMNQKYSERQNLLNTIMKEKSEQLVEITSLSARLVGLEHASRSLKAQYAAGQILSGDYEKESELYSKEMETIKKEIGAQKNALSEEENKIKQQNIDDFGNKSPIVTVERQSVSPKETAGKEKKPQKKKK